MKLLQFTIVAEKATYQFTIYKVIYIAKKLGQDLENQFTIV